MKRLGIGPPRYEIKNSPIVLLVFTSVILFQLTTLKYIWNIELLGRIVNFLILIGATIYSAVALIRGRFDWRIYGGYFFPGLMILIGFFCNLLFNLFLNLSVVGQFGLLIPWVVYLTIPQLLKNGDINSLELWRYFYCFMVAATILGVIEYALVFFGGWGLRSIKTSGGQFLAAWFSAFHELDDGSVYYRIYACFPEPGTLAMYLLPAIAYAWVHKKIGMLLLFIGVVLFTDSLGGYVGLGMLFFIFTFIASSDKRLRQIFMLLFLFFGAAIFLASFSDDLMERYEQKGNSRITREANFTNFIDNFPHLVVSYPLGFPLTESSEEASANKDYFGSNFALGNAFVLGGIISFLGYAAVLSVSLLASVKSLFRRSLSREEKIVYVSLLVLLPFIFQRAVVWDSALFALLFAPVLIRAMQPAYEKTEG